MYAAIRVRGTVGITSEVRDTLKMLRLDHPNACAIVPENPNFKGMLDVAREWITYGEIEKATLVEMLKKRLRLNGNKRVDEGKLKEIGVDSFDALADNLMNGKTKLKNLNQIQPFFRLTPPSNGFKAVREHYPKGDLGYRGKEVNELLMRMI